MKRWLLFGCCLVAALVGNGAEASKAWELEATAKDAQPSLDVPVSMDLALAKGISFDWKCDDVSHIERILIYLQDRTGKYGYALRAQTSPSAEWTRVTVEKCDLVVSKTTAKGLGEVTGLKFYCQRRDQGDFRFAVRDVRVETVANTEVALLMIDAGVERRSTGNIAKVFFLELGGAHNDLRECGLESIIVSERDLATRELPPSVKVVWLPWRDRSVDTTKEWLAAFKAKGGKVLVGRRKDVGEVQPRFEKLVPELADRMKAAKAERARQAKLMDDRAAAYPPKAGELRVLGCHRAWGPKGPWKDWDAAAKFAAENGITHLKVNFCRGPFAAYQSEVLLPWPVEELRKQGDALELCRAACRKYGLGLVAWRVCWQAPEWLAPKEVAAKFRAEGRFQKLFDGREKDWLCPSHPANVKQEVDAMVELAKKGGIEAVSLDYIRYPDDDCCFCDNCRKAFERHLGRAVTNWPQDVRADEGIAKEWRAFRKANIARVVQAIAARVHAEAPGVKLMMSGFELADKAPDAVGQDWPAWCREGWIDTIFPMTYRNSKTDYRDTVVRLKKLDIGRATMYPMIGPSCWRPVGDDALRIAEQVEVVREEGFGGFGIFEYDARAERFLPPLGRGPFKRVQRLKFGVMTDTHVGNTDESCWKVRKACELFRREKCELIINAGDIADIFELERYAAYRRAFDAAFGEEPKPPALYTYAFHDACFYGGYPRADIMKHIHEAFAEVEKALDANPPTAKFVLNGYTFLVFPQHIGYEGFPSWKDYEAAIAAACRESAGKPVFVVDHIPSGGVWGGGPSRRTSILSKYPQVVQFCGHAHGSVRSDLLIWQGNYTVVHAGCLHNWDAGTVGCDSGRREGYGALTVEVGDDGLHIRRWDVRDGSEIGADDPWKVPVPFVASTAPWEPKRRAAKVPAPEFADAAKLIAECITKKGDFQGVRLQFPAVPKAYMHKVEVQRKGTDGAWTTYTWQEALDEWWLAEKDRKGMVETVVAPTFLDAGAEVRFAVTPRNAYDGYGKRTIVSEPLTLPEFGGARKVVYETKNPLADLSYGLGNGRKPLQPQDGWIGPVKDSSIMMKLPDGAFTGSKRGNYRIILEAETEQTAEITWKIRIQNAKGRGFGSSERLATPTGKSGSMRYVMDCSAAASRKRDATDTFWLWFSGNSSGRLRPLSVRIEAL